MKNITVFGMQKTGPFEFVKANSLRGRAADDLAREFVRDYPIPSELTNDELDKWFESHGRLVLPPYDSPKDSDAWQGHLQRRHQIIKKLNRASSHPRMNDGSCSFILQSLRGKWLVRSPQEGILTADIPKAAQTLVRTKRKRLQYLIESADFTLLDPFVQDKIEDMVIAIDKFAARLAREVKDYDDDYDRLVLKIKRVAESGQIELKNHGLQRFLSHTRGDTGDDL